MIDGTASECSSGSEPRMNIDEYAARFEEEPGYLDFARLNAPSPSLRSQAARPGGLFVSIRAVARLTAPSVIHSSSFDLGSSSLP